HRSGFIIVIVLAVYGLWALLYRYSYASSVPCSARTRAAGLPTVLAHYTLHFYSMYHTIVCFKIRRQAIQALVVTRGLPGNGLLCTARLLSAQEAVQEASV